MNPLLDNTSILPRFSDIKAEHMVPAIKEAVLVQRITIKTLMRIFDQGVEITYDNLVRELDDADSLLDNAWSTISHLNSVVTSDDIRKAYNECIEVLTDFSNWLGQHEGLYNAYKSIKARPDFNTLTDAEKQTVENCLRNFVLSGIALSDTDKDLYNKLSTILSKLTTKFSENCLDSRQEWSLLVCKDELKGVPQSHLDAFAEAAENQDKKGYLLTLDLPCYIAVMSHCENRDLREVMYKAYITIASSESPTSSTYDNTPIAEQIVKLRRDKANLLGYATYAELSLEKKMVDTPQQVFDFLNELADKAQVPAKQEAKDLQEFAEVEYGFEGKLEPWDRGYYSERQCEELFSYSEEDVRPYFPAPTVVDGLFNITQTLFEGISFLEDSSVDVWHEDVQYYWIISNSDNQKLAGFYLDLYARNNKRGGAWMDDCRVRKITSDGNLQLPVAFLTCNFNAPVGDDPALLTHDEVTTLFHEFGHGLHHMLTKVVEPAVSGINGVPWDAVELPSQFLENWCWEKDALPLYSKHYLTGEDLPERLIDKMIESKVYGAASGLLRQIEFALFDFYTYMEPEDGRTIQEILDDVRSAVAVYDYPKYSRFMCNFSHIFAGGYAAGYYSYLWAEVLSADAFSKFEEEGIFNSTTGKLFKETILEKGGTSKPLDLFVDFRGRQPDVIALLRHKGVI